MSSSLHSRFLSSSVVTPALLALLLGAPLAGCKTSGLAGGTPPVLAATERSEADWRRELDSLGARYRANPKDAAIAVRYAQALRAIGQRAQAASVLEQAAIANPKDQAVLGAYGRALADAGNYAQAFDILTQAHTPDQPDWRILSVQGAVLDQMGRHEEARRYYSSALKLVPDEPSVLSNLGLSYALSKELPQAESTLRRAAAKGASDARVRQNLALVIGLQGRFDEAETVARGTLPAEEAAANVAYLRQMLSRPSGPRKTPPIAAQGS